MKSEWKRKELLSQRKCSWTSWLPTGSGWSRVSDQLHFLQRTFLICITMWSVGNFDHTERFSCVQIFGKVSEKSENCWGCEMRTIQKKIWTIAGAKSNRTDMSGTKVSTIWIQPVFVCLCVCLLQLTWMSTWKCCSIFYWKFREIFCRMEIQAVLMSRRTKAALV